MQGVATDQASGRRAARVQVYGVDDRFWTFHGAARTVPPRRRARASVLLSPALARELGAQTGAHRPAALQQPSAIPLESLHGRKDDVGRTLR